MEWVEGAGFTILKSYHMNYSAALMCPAVFTVLGQKLQRLLFSTMNNFAALAFVGESRLDLSQADGAGGPGGAHWKHLTGKISIGPIHEWPFQQALCAL